MPFARATLTQLRDDALQDVGTQTITDATTGQVVSVTMFVHSPLRAICYATAGGVYTGYGYLDWIALQATPWNATDEFAAGWGALKGVKQKPATYAVGGETVAGPADTDIPAGSVLSRGDGFTYATSTDVTIGAAGAAVITFAATATGAIGNAAIGTTLVFATPIKGLAPKLVTANAIVDGADIEDPNLFKQRYLAAYAQPPAGGSKADYPEWAQAVPGVTRAWCNPNGAGAGTVVVYTMWDVANAQWGGFPQGSDGVSVADTRAAAAQGDQLTVANAIEPQRPVTALVASCAPIAAPVNFALNNCGAGANATTKAAIQTALTNLFRVIGSPLGVTLYPNIWEGVLASIPFLQQYTPAAPIGALTFPVGSLAVLGTVTLNP